MSELIDKFKLNLSLDKFVTIGYNIANEYDPCNPGNILIWINETPVLSRLYWECTSNHCDHLNHPYIGLYSNYNEFINLLMVHFEDLGYKVKVKYYEVDDY